MRKKTWTAAAAVAAIGVFLVHAAAAAEPPKATILQYELWLPSKTAAFPVIQEFYKGLEDATGGAVKVQFNTGGSMGKVGDTYDRTLKGVSNIGHFNPAFNTGVFPMWDMFNFPIRAPSGKQIAQFQVKMYEKGYFDKEFSQVKIIGLYNIGSCILYSNKKLTTLESLTGMKIRVPSDAWVEVSKAIGAVPVTIETGEMFLAMQKGIVDVIANHWDAARVFKLNEVCRYINELNLMTTTHIVAMNKKTWERLPKEGKAYLDAKWKEYAVKCADAHEKMVPEFKKGFLDTGPDRELVQFASGELEKLDQKLSPIWAAWVSEREKRGLPAKKALDDLYKMMSDEGLKFPMPGYKK
jgi:TRAP-type transport system periplasmic protein